MLAGRKYYPVVDYYLSFLFFFSSNIVFIVLSSLFPQDLRFCHISALLKHAQTNGTLQQLPTVHKDQTLK
jgi:hypothetical protein